MSYTEKDSLLQFYTGWYEAPQNYKERAEKIMVDAEKRLARKLTGTENRFITSKAGFVALEMIHHTTRAGMKEEMETYLNSKSGKKSLRPAKEV